MWQPFFKDELEKISALPGLQPAHAHGADPVNKNTVKPITSTNTKNLAKAITKSQKIAELLLGAPAPPTKPMTSSQISKAAINFSSVPANQNAAMVTLKGLPKTKKKKAQNK